MAELDRALKLDIAIFEALAGEVVGVVDGADDEDDENAEAAAAPPKRSIFREGDPQSGHDAGESECGGAKSDEKQEDKKDDPTERGPEICVERAECGHGDPGKVAVDESIDQDRREANEVPLEDGDERVQSQGDDEEERLTTKENAHGRGRVEESLGVGGHWRSSRQPSVRGRKL